MTHTRAAKVVFAITLSAYVALLGGAIFHPSENNFATWVIWVFLATTFTWSQAKEGHTGWLMPLAYCIGNVFLVALMLVVGGATWNLGEAEAIILFGMTGAFVVWFVRGVTTKKWGTRILYWGSVGADFISFYPTWKQFLGTHPSVSLWTIAGWCCFFVAALGNLIYVERCLYRLALPADEYKTKYDKEKRVSEILEGSLLSIEVLVSVGATLLFMLF